MFDYSEEALRRYSRHILLPDVGVEGQERIRQGRVLVVGAGGLGSPVLLYLAAAGVGHLGIVDGDVVDLSNLQRQVIHATPDVGHYKVESARQQIIRLNPDVRRRGIEVSDRYRPVAHRLPAHLGCADHGVPENHPVTPG